MDTILTLAEAVPGSWEWIMAVLSIVMIDVVLAGDNAVVIAMAVRTLPPRQRLTGIFIGAGAAVVLRVVLTFVAAQLLAMPYIQLVGGLLILWIAVKLLLENAGDEEGGKEAHTLWHAIWLILVADITMSTDNVLAVAGASHGSFGLLLFGLGLSIPFVVFASNLLSRLMDRYPAIVFIGAAILGKVGLGMIIEDKLLHHHLPQSHWFSWSVQAAGAVGVVLVAQLIRRWRSPGARPAPAAQPAGE